MFRDGGWDVRAGDSSADTNDAGGRNRRRNRRITHVEATDSDSGTTYSPVVTYEYTFDGQTYTNDNIELIGEPGFDTPDGAEEFLQSYTAGDRVTVYVDSRNPSRSFLRRGSQGLLIYGVIGAVGIMGLLSVVALVADLSGADWVDIK